MPPRKRTLGWGEHIFVDLLKLDRSRVQHVIHCPFHRDSGASMSIDLVKAVFFCHGSCDEPKGGGAVQFLVKWARIVEGKPITLDEARHRVNRIIHVPSAQELAREYAADDARLFATVTLSAQAQRALDTERLARDFMSTFRKEAEQGEDWVWIAYDALLRSVRDYDDALEITSRSRRVTASLVALVRAARARGWWDDARHDAAEAHVEFVREIRRKLRALDDEGEQESTCELPTTKTPPVPDTRPKRTRVPHRTPVTD